MLRLVILRRLKRYIIGIIKYQKYREGLPLNPKTNDVYLVEFPKSGVTWLSFIMGNVNSIKYNLNIRPTFYNIRNFVAEIECDQKIKIYFPEKMPFRLIKSHSEHNPYYNHVIYILRHPVSVMISYYYFSMNYSKVRINFYDFVNDKKFGIDSYINHVNSWLNAESNSQRIHLIKYEDLIKNPETSIKAIYANLGYDIDDSVIDEAIMRSSKENMMLSENHYKKFSPNYDFNFVRQGSADFSKETILTKDIQLLIESKAKHIIDLYYSNKKN